MILNNKEYKTPKVTPRYIKKNKKNFWHVKISRHITSHRQKNRLNVK